MNDHPHPTSPSAIFITFSGNCKQALTFYQTCFGGQLRFETFEPELNGYATSPVVSGSLLSERITIHGSDLVPGEGRKVGNYVAIYLHCENTKVRQELISKLKMNPKESISHENNSPRLIEVTDTFDVKWILGV